MMTFKKSFFKFGFWVVCLCISVVAIIIVVIVGKGNNQNQISIEEEAGVIYDMPPMVYVNDSLYKRISFVSDICLNDECIYMGEIKSNVDSSQTPSENYQSNSNLIGAKIYKNGDDIIIVYHEFYELYSVI